MKNKNPQEIVQQHYDKLVSHGYNVLGVFLYGSQNYEMDYHLSDVDTKAIVIPSVNDTVLNKQPESTKKDTEDGGQCEIKDIRKMFECFKKQNINFVEILFTKYKVINPKYLELYQPMLDNNEKIARYNDFKSINGIVGMMFEKLKALEKPCPSTKDKIEKYGYDPKQLHHIARLSDFLYRYADNKEPYKDILIPKNKEYVKSLKTQIIDLESAREIAEHLTETAHMFKDSYFEENIKPTVDNSVEQLMNEVLFNIIKKSFREELTDEN